MSRSPESTIRVRVDPTNPGQFFACCGLLELADRLWKGAEGWFEGGIFCIRTEEDTALLPALLAAAQAICLAGDPDADDDDDDSDEIERESPPFVITSPVSLGLDWWQDKSLKTWAGSMNERKIFLAMCNAIDPKYDNPLNQRTVVFDTNARSSKTAHSKRCSKPKKREPFYFDARRGASAWSIDVGFSTDSLKLTTVAYPVVEAMSLVGLQRCRPKPTDMPRVFDYFIWNMPLPVMVVPVAVSGLVGNIYGFRFMNAFRTSQKKHKAFNPATPIQRR
ncbi:MAG: hypothetical protein HZA20_07135 [Nitrospirae bacterium]|nr:hypothetical protein [Nitrospirota bacterium]